MSPSDLPPLVPSFIAENVRTLSELQLLMAMIQFDERWWDAKAVARELGISRHEARASLDALAARNLLDIKITEDVRYQFRPGTPELRDAALAASEAYRRQPIDVVRLLGAPGRRSIADFADAFRIRRHDDP